MFKFIGYAVVFYFSGIGLSAWIKRREQELAEARKKGQPDGDKKSEA